MPIVHNAAKEVASKPPSKCPSSRKSKASSAKRREITLQRLEEEKAMAEKIAIEKIELEKRALNEKEERFREHLRQKSMILIDDLSESEEGSVFDVDKQKEVSKWLNQGESSRYYTADSTEATTAIDNQMNGEKLSMILERTSEPIDEPQTGNYLQKAQPIKHHLLGFSTVGSSIVYS